MRKLMSPIALVGCWIFLLLLAVICYVGWGRDAAVSSFAVMNGTISFYAYHAGYGAFRQQLAVNEYSGYPELLNSLLFRTGGFVSPSFLRLVYASGSPIKAYVDPKILSFLKCSHIVSVVTVLLILVLANVIG